MFGKKHRSLMFKAILMLIVFILPLNILSIITMNTVISNTEDSISASISSSLDFYTYHLEKKLENTDYLLYTVSDDPDCKEYFRQPDTWKYTFHRYQVYRKFLQSLSIVDAADGIYFHLPNQEDLLYVDSDSRDSISAEAADKFLSSAEIPDGKWHLYNLDGTSCLIRNIQSGTVSYGAIINCEKDLPVFDYDNSSLFFTDKPIENEKNMILCTSASAKSGCTLAFTLPRSELSGNVETWKYILVLVLGICFLIIPVLYYAFRRSVSRPLNELNHAHNQLLVGNEAYRISAQANSSEFSMAFLAFNNMARTLQELRLEKINRELAYKQMQLNNLQLQIRPHFLLNAMNLLYTLIHSKQTEAAKELVLYISRYFRYMFRKGKELELFEKELSLIREYLNISQIHYPDAFTVSYQIDPMVHLLRVPPLLFHNFVENIIHHALVPGRIVHIVLFGEYEDGIITLQISDDGRGMCKEDVDMINHRTFPPENTGQHIGIRNSIRRLDYYYNGQAEVSVEAAPDLGTTFTITIPCNLEENENEAADCK